MRNGFAGCHPAVNFLYFCLILGFAAGLSHPLCRLFSLLGACLWLLRGAGGEALRRQAAFLLPLMLLATLLNPLLSHKGVTILAYLPTGNPLTMEAMFYGFSMALLLAGIIAWFSCFQRVMTGEKLACLFGKRFPALTLLFIMTLGFVPRFQVRFREVRNARQGIGQGVKENCLRDRFAEAGRIFATLLSCTLEDAIETADSMKSRGYGEAGRSTYAPYRFSQYDKGVLFAMLALAAGILFFALHGGFAFAYYPALRGVRAGIWSLCAFSAYLALCLTPWIIERREGHQWRSMRYES